MQRGLFWSFLASFLAAAFLIPYRYAGEEASRLAAATAMFVVAAVFSAAIASFRPRGAGRVLDRVALGAAVGLAVFTVLGNLGIAFALPRIGTGLTSVVLKAQVVLTPMLAIPVLKEQASLRIWGGAMLALSGVAIPQLLAEPGQGDAVGYLWAFGAAVAFAGMQLLTRRVITRIDPPVVNAVRLVLAAVVLQLLPGGRDAWSLSVTTWMFAAAAGFLGPGLSRLCLMTAARHISPSLTALVSLAGPVLAFGLGYLFFAEVPSAWEIAGSGLVLVGVLLPVLPNVRVRELGVKSNRPRSGIHSRARND